MFALVVFVSDGLLADVEKTDGAATPPAAGFFKMATRLPLELQMMLCYPVVGSTKKIIPGVNNERAFKDLVKSIS